MYWKSVTKYKSLLTTVRTYYKTFTFIKHILERIETKSCLFIVETWPSYDKTYTYKNFYTKWNVLRFQSTSNNNIKKPGTGY